MSEPIDQAEAERHRAKMAKRKVVQDKEVAGKTIEKGLLIVHTGTGKGKSTAAFGLALRMLGRGRRVGVVQFIKGSFSTGEEAFFRRFPEEVDYHVMGEGFTWETQDQTRDIAAAEAAWGKARDMLSDPSYDLVLLDELNIALALQYVALDRVLAALASRPPEQHVVITGRGAPTALIEVADTVTEMRLVKHAFQAGIKEQPGVEL